LEKVKKKVLFVATVDSHIELFHLPYLETFKKHGYEVHVATNTNKKIDFCDKKHKISIERNPFRLNNLKAIRQLKKIVNNEHFDIIHCHTPMGGVVARLAAKKARKNGTRVIYTAHGFHFFTGAPLKNWLLFYPVEKYLAKYTDTLITINTEDFERAKKKFSKRCKDIQYVPGVGVDEKKFSKKLSATEKHNLRKSLGLKDDDFVMIFSAELSNRKNQMWLITTLKPIFGENKNAHLLLPGRDSMGGQCQELAKKLGVSSQVHFLGFRKDVYELLQISNLAVSSSKQEGLPVNLIEASYVDLPIIATDCRGNRDIIENGASGTVVKPENFTKIIEKYKNRKHETQKNIAQKLYSSHNINKLMDKIYFQREGM
jgi:glycosyltransferase EpsD